MRAPKTETDIRREQIVAAALELVGDNGVHSLSIAGRVGIAPSALYRHFRNKDEVLDGVLALLKKRLLDNVAHAREEALDALSRLRRLLMKHADTLNENRAIPLVVFSDGVYAGAPDRKAKVADILKSYTAEIQRLLEEGVEEGRVRPDIDLAAASVLFIGMVLPAAVFRNIAEGDFDMTAHVRAAWPLFERAIGTKEDVPAG